MQRIGTTVTLFCLMALVSVPTASAAGETVREIIRVPKKIAGCMVGLAVGTPVAIARTTAKRVHEHRADFSDVESPTNVGNLVLALPLGFGEGLCGGMFYGPRNAFMAEPFSKESMSLGESVGGP